MWDFLTECCLCPLLEQQIWTGAQAKVLKPKGETAAGELQMTLEEAEASLG